MLKVFWIVVVVVLKVPPTAKVIWRQGHSFKSHPTDWPGIEPATPCLEGRRFIQYTMAAPIFWSAFEYICSRYNEQMIFSGPPEDK